MRDPNELLNNKNFLANVRDLFGEGKVMLMTPESHPEIMALYTRLCTKKGKPQRPVFVVKTEANYACALHFPDDDSATDYTKAIAVSTAFMRNKSPLEICSDFGYEEGHMSPFSRRQLLGMAASFAGWTSVPWDVRLADVGLRKTGIFPEDSPAASIAKTFAAGMATIISLPLGILAVLRRKEHACDEEGAKLAGPEAAISSLEKDREHETRARRSLNMGLLGYPSINRRIGHIKRKFGVTDPEDLLNNKRFMADLRKTLGDGAVTVMTQQTHPEIMSLYSNLCQQVGKRERTVILVESPIANAAAIRTRWSAPVAIIITSALLENKSAARVCAILFHEEPHFSRRQLLKHFLTETAIATVPLDVVAVDGGLRIKGVLQQDSGWRILAKLSAAAALMPVVDLLGCRAVSRGAEYNCDAESAKIAGPGPVLDNLREERREEIKEEDLDRRLGLKPPSKPVRILKALLADHPPVEKRIRHIEHTFADELKREAEARDETGRAP